MLCESVVAWRTCAGRAARQRRSTAPRASPRGKLYCVAQGGRNRLAKSRARYLLSRTLEGTCCLTHISLGRAVGRSRRCSARLLNSECESVSSRCCHYNLIYVRSYVYNWEDTNAAQKHDAYTNAVDYATVIRCYPRCVGHSRRRHVGKNCPFSQRSFSRRAGACRVRTNVITTLCMCRSNVYNWKDTNAAQNTQTR